MPLNPAIEPARPLLIITRASVATLSDKSVAPAPVSIAKVNGPAELTQVLTNKPRPGMSRKETGRGIEGRDSTACGFEDSVTSERAASKETALATIAKVRSTAFRSLGCIAALPL